MNIIESNRYKKSYKKIIINKHLIKEDNELNNLINIIESCSNLQSLMSSSYQQFYDIRQKEGNLKEYISASLSKRVRLIMKPLDCLPYNYLSIEDIEFIEINDEHYKNM
jgi:hypothetical protein